MWQVGGIYGVKFQPPRPGLEPSHSTLDPSPSPFVLIPNSPSPVHCYPPHCTMHIPHIRDHLISVFMYIASVNNSKRFEWYCTLKIEQNFVIEVCVKQIFPRISNSVNSCLSDPLERVYRSLKFKSDTGITKYQANKRSRGEYERQACSKLNFSCPDPIWKEKSC